MFHHKNINNNNNYYSDDISNIVHQILVHSSTSSSSGMANFGGPTENPRRLSRSQAPSGGGVKQGMIFTVDSCGRECGGSSLVGAACENETDEYDCESEVSVAV